MARYPWGRRGKPHGRDLNANPPKVIVCLASVYYRVLDILHVGQFKGSHQFLRGGSSRYLTGVAYGLATSR